MKIKVARTNGDLAIVLDDKYTFCKMPNDHRTHVLRNAEPWFEIKQGSRAVLMLMQAIEQLVHEADEPRAEAVEEPAKLLPELHDIPKLIEMPEPIDCRCSCKPDVSNCTEDMARAAERIELAKSIFIGFAACSANDSISCKLPEIAKQEANAAVMWADVLIEELAK